MSLEIIYKVVSKFFFVLSAKFEIIIIHCYMNAVKHYK